MTTDRLLFRPTEGREITFPWSNQWPPPDRLYLVPDGSGVVLVDPDSQSEHTLAQLVLDHDAVLYVQVSASQQREPAREDEHWFREALYEPWTG